MKYLCFVAATMLLNITTYAMVLEKSVETYLEGIVEATERNSEVDTDELVELSAHDFL